MRGQGSEGNQDNGLEPRKWVTKAMKGIKTIGSTMAMGEHHVNKRIKAMRWIMQQGGTMAVEETMAIG